MKEKLLAPLVEEEEQLLRELLKERSISAYFIVGYMIKELFLFKSMLNEKRLFKPSDEDIARIIIRVYLLSGIVLDKLGYKE